MEGIEILRAGSWRRSGLSEELPHYLLDLHEARRTVRVRERKLCRIHTMGLAIRPLTYPALETRGCSRLLLNTPQAQQVRSSDGAMNVSLIEAEGASRVV